MRRPTPTRKCLLDLATFAKLYGKAGPFMQALMITALDTGATQNELATP